MNYANVFVKNALFIHLFIYNGTKTGFIMVFHDELRTIFQENYWWNKK